MTQPFSVTAFCARLGLTDESLGELLRLSESDPARSIRMWRRHEATGRGSGPSAQAVELMMLVELIWRLYHAPGRTKKLLRAVLPKELRDRKPTD